MHQPRPYGLLVVGGEPTSEDSAAIELLARRLTNLKTLSGVESLRMVRSLPGGGYVIAQDMGGTFRCVVQKPVPRTPPPPSDGVAKDYIPMLFSGVITGARLRDGAGTGIRLTEQARRRIANYAPDALPPKNLELHRFAIEYADKFGYFKPKDTGIYTFTQYDKLRPTWYSGAMAEVVQVIGGYGRQVFEDLPDDPIERARLRVPKRYMKRIHEELGSKRLPGYTGLPDEEGQITFDYQASQSHAVAFDNTDAPWLLQISARGVYAMPLPMVPATTTMAFREFMEECGDSEILALLDRFGGMPSGESFPRDAADFEAWRRAGVIVKVCDTADFYQYSAYYMASGWSFNSRGSEGFNTCYSYASTGLLQGHAYKMRIRLAAADDRGMLAMKWAKVSAEDTARINAYLSGLLTTLSALSDPDRAVLYKIRRSSVQDVLARAGRDGRSDRDYWDALEMPPIAAHAGSVTRVASGPLYWPSKNPLSSGRLKFPELTGKGCESFALISPDYAGPAVKCDTIVFGCYVNDELQVIKYFYDERDFVKEKESTLEEVMIVGQWSETVTTGHTGLAGHFYTSSFDDRQEISPSVTTTSIVGTDLGYGQPAYTTPALMFSVGSLSRARYYQHRTKSNTTSSRGMDAAVLVPLYARDCIQYAYSERTGSRAWSETTTMASVRDPNSYELWCYDNIFHYIGSTRSGNLGVPRSKDGTPVYVDTHNYNPTEYSDFADGGNWFGLPEGGFIDVTAICGPYTSRYAETFQAGGVVIGGAAPGFSPYAASGTQPSETGGRLSVSICEGGNVVAHRDVPHSWYFGYSPRDDYYFYRDATWIAFGESRYASIFEKDQYQLRRRWGSTALADHKTAHHFIGVINE